MSVIVYNGQPLELRGALASVSPSFFHKLKQWHSGQACGLQFLWSGRSLLCPPPAAKLGDILHKLMEAGTHAHSPQQARSLWDAAKARIEQDLESHWTTRGLLPLDRKTRGYELKRSLALRSILSAASAFTPASALPRAPAGHILQEEPLISADGALRGQVDLAEERTGGWVLTDFKSGSVLEEHGEGGFRIKEAYELQLLLYACLLKEAKGITLKRAVLQTMDGREHPVDLADAKVGAVGEEARSLLRAFNARLQQCSSPADFAKPLPAVWESGTYGCLGCLFRPACAVYRASKKEIAEAQAWPRDAWGFVSYISHSPGRLEVEIQNQNNLVNAQGQSANPVFRISLEGSEVRHPAIQGLQPGHLVEIYDYLKTRSGMTAQDGPRTCVYRASKDITVGSAVYPSGPHLKLALRSSCMAPVGTKLSKTPQA